MDYGRSLLLSKLKFGLPWLSARFRYLIVAEPASETGEKLMKNKGVLTMQIKRAFKRKDS